MTGVQTCALPISTAQARPAHKTLAWVKRYFKSTQAQWRRIKLLGMMLFVAFLAAMGTIIFEKSLYYHGVPEAEIITFVEKGSRSPDFFQMPALRVRVKGTARNCQSRAVQVEIRVMDSDGKPLPLLIPEDREKYRKWPRFKKEKGNFGYSFEDKPDDAFYSISKTVDLPYFLFVPADAEQPFNFFVSTRIITSRREALALKDTDFLEAPAGALSRTENKAGSKP